jgi:hypothetical protein
MLICRHVSRGCIDHIFCEEDTVKTGFLSYGILLLSLIPACMAGAFGGWPTAAVAWVGTLFGGGGLYSLFAWLFDWPRLRLNDLPVVDGWLP